MTLIKSELIKILNACQDLALFRAKKILHSSHPVFIHHHLINKCFNYTKTWCHVIVLKSTDHKIRPTRYKKTAWSRFRSRPRDQGIIFGSSNKNDSCIYNQNYPELELNRNVFGLAVSHRPNPTYFISIISAESENEDLEEFNKIMTPLNEWVPLKMAYIIRLKFWPGDERPRRQMMSHTDHFFLSTIQISILIYIWQ